MLHLQLTFSTPVEVGVLRSVLVVDTLVVILAQDLGRDEFVTKKVLGYTQVQ